MNKELPVALLTIAGSDPSGGAGLQADLRVWSSLGLYGMSVVTSVTAQNTAGVQAVYSLPRDQVAAQLQSVISDMPPAVSKAGMLPTLDIVEEISTFSSSGMLGKLVIDPVLISTSGAALTEMACISAIVEKLLPQCFLVTPNLFEAEKLAGFEVQNGQDALRAAHTLVEMGAGAACVTGGHLSGDPVDYYVDADQVLVLTGSRIKTGKAIHGTGCIFSAAAAGYIASGDERLEAVRKAKLLIEAGIQGAILPGGGMLVPWL